MYVFCFEIDNIKIINNNKKKRLLRYIFIKHKSNNVRFICLSGLIKLVYFTLFVDHKHLSRIIDFCVINLLMDKKKTTKKIQYNKSR